MNELEYFLKLLAQKVKILEQNMVNDRYYKYSKTTNMLDIPDTWTPVTSILAENAVSGVYEIKISVQGFMGDTSDAAMIRFQVNNGGWTEFRREAKDNDDTVGWTYLYPIPHLEGDILLELEAKKETGGTRYDIQFADTIIEKVL